MANEAFFLKSASVGANLSSSVTNERVSSNVYLHVLCSVYDSKTEFTLYTHYSETAQRHGYEDAPLHTINIQ